MPQVWAEAIGVKNHVTLIREVLDQIEAWILSRDKRTARLFLTEKDKLRLLRLRIWAMRYKISISEILDLIVPPLRKKTIPKARNMRKGGIGIAAATLTGVVAEQILQDRLTERYPDGAHVGVWKEAERERQLRAEREEEADGMTVRRAKMPKLMEIGDVDEYSRLYADAVMRKRQNIRGQQTWRKRKRYRNNPWL